MEIINCRICNASNFTDLFSLGLQPLANNFLRSKHLLLTQKRYPLNLRFCNNCGLVQLTKYISAKKLFSEYNYVPSISNTLVSHFKKASEDVCKVAMMTPGDFVVDIGSNDGLLLKQFLAQGMNVLGVEPAKNIARQANENGIDTINAFFDSQVVENILETNGQAKVITATNVMAHVNDLRSFISDIENLLSHNGVFVAEFPYLVDLVEKKEFDTIYHEHLSYFQ